MILSADGVAKDSVLDTDICVIGSGPAGLSFALEFAASGKNICILEAGEFEPSGKVQALYDMESVDLPISPQSRARVFGGTSTAWYGLWKSFDPIDFVPRSWVPRSGWPVGNQELSPYYLRASNFFHVPSLPAYNTQNIINSENLETKIIQRVPESFLDLGKSLREQLERSQNISVYLGANVTKLEASSDQKQISSIQAKTLNGNNFAVSAGTVVLACGGIENARLLLHSQLGGDSVGRYYMDHPKGRLGAIVTKKPVKLFPYWGAEMSQESFRAVLTVTQEAQEKRQILNSSVMFEPVVNSFSQKILKKFFRRTPAASLISMRNSMEQTPSADNRVTLSEKKDQFGNPLAKVAWQIGELDKKTMKVFHGLLKEEFAGSGIGTFESPLLGAMHGDWPITDGASHHMGTTRMGKDPGDSVVNENCQTHELDNLFIAGSSVFPTGGYANPTATIVALAIRLADYIKNK